MSCPRSAQRGQVHDIVPRIAFQVPTHPNAGGPIMSAPEKNRIGRRTFLAASAAAGITIVRASQVRGTQANSTIEVGLVGCGGRGRWIARLFAQHGGYHVAAVADYFQEQAD